MSRLAGTIFIAALGLSALALATQSPPGEPSAPGSPPGEPSAPGSPPKGPGSVKAFQEFKRRPAPSFKPSMPKYMRPDEVPPQWGSGPLRVAIYTAKSRYRQLEPIWIDYQVAVEPGASPTGLLFITSGSMSSNLAFKVLRQGVEVPATAFLKPPPDYPWPGRLESPSGQSRTIGTEDKSPVRGAICVNLLYDMTMPGRYSITVDAVGFGWERGEASKSGLRPKLSGTSKTIEIEVQGGPTP